MAEREYQLSIKVFFKTISFSLPPEILNNPAVRWKSGFECIGSWNFYADNNEIAKGVAEALESDAIESMRRDKELTSTSIELFELTPGAGSAKPARSRIYARTMSAAIERGDDGSAEEYPYRMPCLECEQFPCRCPKKDTPKDDKPINDQ